ncbi:hypothetical protein [Sorangium cellulosum]|uniref:hypothetical protein n=1 Tax=Sorangium sp. So ce176 TaxID=3133286 RepID=UPI0018F5B245
MGITNLAFIKNKGFHGVAPAAPEDCSAWAFAMNGNMYASATGFPSHGLRHEQHPPLRCLFSREAGRAASS